MTNQATTKIAVVVGSLRKNSINRNLARALTKITPKGVKLETVEIGDLPLYDQDLDDENRAPAAWTAFREKIRTYDAVLFITPEYNRSVPAALKNAIDVGSRPYGQSVWDGKPAAIISSSPGALGGFGANHHLRQSLVFLNMPILQHEAYIGNAGNLLRDDGSFVSDDTQAFFAKLLTTFAAWIATTSPKAQAQSAAA